MFRKFLFQKKSIKKHEVDYYSMNTVILNVKLKYKKLQKQRNFDFHLVKN